MAPQVSTFGFVLLCAVVTFARRRRQESKSDQRRSFGRPKRNVKRGLFLACIAVAAACVLFATHRSVAQETNGQAFVQRNPRLIPESHHDVSPPLSSLPTTILRETEEHEKWNGMRPTPFKGTGREVDTQVD